MAPHAQSLIVFEAMGPLLGIGAAVIAMAVAAASAVGVRIYKTLADGYRDERDLANERAARLEQEKLDLAAVVDDLRIKVRDLETHIDELRLKDVSALFDLMQHHDERMTEARDRQQDTSREIIRQLDVVAGVLERVAVATIPPI